MALEVPSSLLFYDSMSFPQQFYHCALKFHMYFTVVNKIQGSVKTNPNVWLFPLQCSPITDGKELTDLQCNIPKCIFISCWGGIKEHWEQRPAAGAVSSYCVLLPSATELVSFCLFYPPCDAPCILVAYQLQWEAGSWERCYPYFTVQLLWLDLQKYGFESGNLRGLPLCERVHGSLFQNLWIKPTLSKCLVQPHGDLKGRVTTAKQTLNYN